MPDESTNTKVRMRVQDQNARAVYANAFRHNSTPNEVILDLGINTVIGRHPASDVDEVPTAEMLFQVDTRLVLNYETARRLTSLLSQIMQQHDQRRQAAMASQQAESQDVAEE
jgi:hypothetical protein